MASSAGLFTWEANLRVAVAAHRGLDAPEEVMKALVKEAKDKKVSMTQVVSRLWVALAADYAGTHTMASGVPTKEQGKQERRLLAQQRQKENQEKPEEEKVCKDLRAGYPQCQQATKCVRKHPALCGRLNCEGYASTPEARARGREICDDLHVRLKVCDRAACVPLPVNGCKLDHSADGQRLAAAETERKEKNKRIAEQQKKKKAAKAHRNNSGNAGGSKAWPPASGSNAVSLGFGNQSPNTGFSNSNSVGGVANAVQQQQRLQQPQQQQMIVVSPEQQPIIDAVVKILDQRQERQDLHLQLQSLWQQPAGRGRGRGRGRGGNRGRAASRGGK
jgi:hypothetical protein